jgi:hypothetical protein
MGYGFGKGVPKDYVHAYVWGSIAVMNGLKTSNNLVVYHAKKLIAALEQDMSSRRIESAKKQLAECVRNKYKNCHLIYHSNNRLKHTHPAPLHSAPKYIYG